MMPETPTIIVPPELRSQLCPNCGYSLKEIADSAKCPECGRECNVSELVIYARDLRPAEAKGASGRQRISDRMIAYVAGGVLFLTFFNNGGFYYPAFLAAAAVCGRLMKLDNKHAGDIQIRINAEGVAQLPSAGGATALRKLAAGFLWVMPTVATLLLVGEWLVRPAHITVWLYAPLSMLMVVFSIIAVRRALIYHFRNRSVPQHAIVDSNLAVTPRSPWKEIIEYWITPSTGGNSYLRIDDQAHRPGLFISASIDLPASHAEALHNLMRANILAARPDAVTGNDAGSDGGH